MQTNKTLQSILRIRLLKSLFISLIVVVIALAIISTYNYQRESDRVHDFINQYHTHQNGAIASQLVIYSIYKQPLDYSLTDLVKGFNVSAQVAIQDKKKICLLGDCTLFNQQSKLLKINIKKPIKSIDDVIGEIVFSIPFSRELLYSFRLVVIIIAIGFLTLIFVLSISFARTIQEELTAPLYQLLQIYKDLKSGNYLEVSKKSHYPQGAFEISALFERFAELCADLERLTESEKNLHAQKRITEIAAQVSHDIRSPLAALDSILQMIDSLPEDARLIIRASIGRIRDIANTLLLKNRELPSEPSAATHVTIELITSHIDSLISEKRLQFRSNLNTTIEFDITSETYGLFAAINVTEFKRMMSNLINNAVEAIKGEGLVRVSLLTDEKNIRLTVKDSGKGIDPEILPKLAQRGQTHGKEGGSGLGLYHARSTVESWGGRLTLESTLGQGTSVIVTFPRSQTPLWFVTSLQITPLSRVVILDDDKTIHQIWSGRFESLKQQGIEVLHFTLGDEIRKWYLKKQEERQTLYLLDYELLGQNDNGLKIIAELGINQQSILVTSRFDEEAIRKQCDTDGVRLIPKGMAALVPIQLQTTEAQQAADSQTGARRASAPLTDQPIAAIFIDAILIDDDPIVRLSWKVSARKNKKNVKIFSDSRGFYDIAPGLKKDTPIYIDSNLAGGIKGEQEARTMHALGFCNIHLATGMQASDFPQMNWIKSITGKQAPWA